MQIIEFWNVSTNTGDVRCNTLHILCDIASNPSTWKVKKGDGSLHCDKLIAFFGKVLEMNAKAKKDGRKIHGKCCEGEGNCEFVIANALVDACIAGKRPIGGIVDFDWTPFWTFNPCQLLRG